MQSGKAALKNWLLEYEPEQPKAVEPLMGWTASGDMRQQISLRFETAEEAVAYAARNNISYEIEQETPSAEASTASYSDNFRADRKGLWTH